MPGRFNRINPEEQFKSLNTLNFVLTDAGIQVIKSKLFQVPTTETEEAIKQSLLNTPIFDNVEFEGGNYKDIEGNTIPFPALTIDTVLVTVSQSKNIITTPLQGRNGTVKEYVSDGDYTISLVGAIVSPYNEYPNLEVKDLISICQAPAALRMTSQFAQLFGISDIVITDYNFPQQRGVINAQSFEISALSDVPIELTEQEI